MARVKSGPIWLFSSFSSSEAPKGEDLHLMQATKGAAFLCGAGRSLFLGLLLLRRGDLLICRCIVRWNWIFLY